MKVPFFTVERQNKEIGNDIKKAISDVIDSGIYADGPKTKEFEELWSEINQIRHSIFTSSGTSALEIAIKCLGDEVPFRAPTNTFFASASQVPWEAGLEFIDSDETCNLDVDKIVGPLWGSLIAVNLYGQPLDYDELFKKVCSNNVILDACQSHFSTYKGKPVATFCKLTAFSFYCTKVLGSMGEAGCLCFNDDSLLEYVKSLRNHGRGKEGYQHDYVSGNLRGDEIQAAILLVKLKQKDEIIEQRISAVARYRKNLQNNNRKIKLLPEKLDCLVVNYVMPVFVKNRDNVKNKLKEAGISTLVHYPICLHNQPAFENWDVGGPFPVAEKQANTELSLPLFYGITNEEIDVVSELLIKTVNET